MIKNLQVIYDQYGLVAVLSILATVLIGYAFRLATRTSAHVIGNAVRDLEIARGALRSELNDERDHAKELRAELERSRDVRHKQTGLIHQLELRIEVLEREIDELQAQA